MVSDSPTFTYDYNYHLTIETESSLYTYSTLQAVTPGRPITFSYLQDEKQRTHQFVVDWQKKVSERVRRVTLVAFMTYSTALVKNGYGMVLGEGTGSNIA